MTLVAIGFIDPKDYPFKKFIDEQKNLDTDELRLTMKPIHHKIDECFKGEEHLYCDKEQLSAEGKFRRPKKLIEAERRGFISASEMDTADKKLAEEKERKDKEEKEEKERKDKEELTQRSIILEKQLADSMKSMEDYKALTEERFNKLLALLAIQ